MDVGLRETAGGGERGKQDRNESCIFWEASDSEEREESLMLFKMLFIYYHVCMVCVRMLMHVPYCTRENKFGGNFSPFYCQFPDIECRRLIYLNFLFVCLLL